MRRHQQFSVSCRPSDWAEIGRRAKAAKMTISRFVVACVVVACVLEEEDDMRLALSEAEQRDLLNRVNRTLLVLEDLLAPLPGSDVTAMEALSFLFCAAGEFQTRHDAGSQEPAS